MNNTIGHVEIRGLLLRLLLSILLIPVSAYAQNQKTVTGTVIDETLKDEIRITVIATGFEKERQRRGMGAQGVTSGATQTQREVIVENVEEKIAEQEVAASSQTQQEDRYNDDLEIPMFLRRGRR